MDEGRRSPFATLRLAAGAALAMAVVAPAAAQDGQPGTSAPAVEPAEDVATGTIETDELIAVVDARGALRSVRLKGEQFVEDDGLGHDVVTTDQPAYLPFQIELAFVDIPKDTVWSLRQESPTAVALSWEGDGVRVTRRFEAGRAPYQIFSTVRVQNLADAPRRTRLRVQTYHYVPREDEKGGFFGAPGPGTGQGICLWKDEVVRHARDDDEIAVTGDDFARGTGWGPEVRFTGVENRYFANVLVAPEARVARCRLAASDRGYGGEVVGSLFQAQLSYDEVQVPAGGDWSARTFGYFGPKDPKALRAAGHDLSRVVDLGVFAVIASALVDLLSLIHDVIPNWGLAIILLTVLVRTLLYPLTFQSFKSMARMRLLKPEMDRINELYADDREKKGAAIMELYRKNKVNPVAGCLPQLLQLPIWWALYTSLSTNFELYHAPFVLWWTDLSAPDPYFVLPLSVGGLIFAQQKLTPTAMDPQQAKIMLYVMPAMIMSFMLFLPSGLCLYIATNSVLGISQQKWIERSLERKGHGAGAVDDGGADDAEPDDGDTGARGSSSTVRTYKPKRKRRGKS